MASEEWDVGTHPFRRTSHNPDRDNEHAEAHPLIDLRFRLLAVGVQYTPQHLRCGLALSMLGMVAARRSLEEDP